jgi:hypothetical protein
MEKLVSKKGIELPIVYYITDREEIKDLPIGIPFIYGSEYMKEHVIQFLEFEVLWENAQKLGYKFNWRKILIENGFKDIENFKYYKNTYINYETTGDPLENEKLEKLDNSCESTEKFRKFIKDASVKVDVRKLKELNVFPVWLTDVEESLSQNIHNFSHFNPYMYNKKLDGVYGEYELKSPKRNLVIIDISGSIPRAVSSTCLLLAKNFSENFYADILITGTKSILYDYENIRDLNEETIYEIGQNNDQKYFKALLEKDERKYGTAIVFGDNDHPGGRWNGKHTISDEDGKKLCKWTIDKLINLHTHNYKGRNFKEIAGYARWFEPKETVHILDWVKYLK